MKRTSSRVINPIEIQGEFNEEPNPKRLCDGINRASTVTTLDIPNNTSFFDRLHDAFSHITEKLSIANILNLKLVSRNDYSYINSVVEIKFQWSVEGVLRLIQEIQQGESKLNIDSIPEKLNICLLVESFERFKLFLKIIAENPQYLKISSKIKGIKLSTDNIIDSYNLNEFNDIVSTNQTFFSQLETLFFDKIYHRVVFTLPKVFEKLKVLSFGDIFAHIILCDLPHLEVLAFGKIHHPTILKLPETLDNLKKLKLGDIEATKLELSTSFKNIEVIELGNLGYSNLIFSQELPLLKNFTVRDIGRNSSIQFPAILPNLKTFTAGCLWKNFELSSNCPALESLIFGNIAEFTNLILKNSFPQLKGLFFRDILQNATLEIGANCPQIQMISIEDIHEDATLVVKDTCNSYKKLQIKRIDEQGNVRLNKSCINLQELSIQEVSKYLYGQLAESLPQLIKASFNQIPFVPCIWALPNRLSTIHEVNFETIVEGVAIIIQSSFKKLKTFYIQKVKVSNIQFIKCDSLMNLKSYIFGLTEDEVTIGLNNNLTRLENFSIGEIFCDVTINLSNCIEILNILTIYENCKINIENASDNLIINLQDVGDNVTFNFYGKYNVIINLLGSRRGTFIIEYQDSVILELPKNNETKIIDIDLGYEDENSM